MYTFAFEQFIITKEKAMSMKNCADKACTALNKSKTWTVDSFDYLRSLSLRSKANFDCRLNSSKKFHPVKKWGFSYDKEIKVFHLIGIMLSVIIILMMILGKCKKYK